MAYEWAHQSEFDRWVAEGKRRGWLLEFCVSHEWLALMTRAERDHWNETADTCSRRLVVENPNNPSLRD